MSSKTKAHLLSILVVLILTLCLGALWPLLKWYRLQTRSQDRSDQLAPAQGSKVYRSGGRKKSHQPSIQSSLIERARLEYILTRMEETSSSFRSFVADITATKYTAILDAFDPPEKGKFFFKRAADGTALVRWEIMHPGERILTIQNDEALVYQPNIQSAQKFRLGSGKDRVEYLALGIGQSPADLKKAYNIAYQGSENVGGAACSILELKPKNPKAAAIFSSITVWLRDSTGVSTRMKLEEPFDDYLLIEFSNEQLNKQIEDSKFRQDLPDGVDMVRIN
jgi:outer membrane lipoprotein-sorting protein